MRIFILILFTTLIVATITAVVVSRQGAQETGQEVGIGGAPPTKSEMEVTTTQSSIIGELAERGNFTIFLESVKALGMLEKLSGPEEFTIFAPTDESFLKVNPDILYPIVTNRESLRSLVNSHIVQGNIENGEDNSAKNLEGGNMNIEDNKVNGMIIQGDSIKTSNGTIYIIDDVIMPRDIIEELSPTRTI